MQEKQKQNTSKQTKKQHPHCHPQFRNKKQIVKNNKNLNICIAILHSLLFPYLECTFYVIAYLLYTIFKILYLIPGLHRTVMLNMSSLNTSNYLDFFSCAVQYFFPLTTKLKVAEKPQTQQLTNQKQRNKKPHKNNNKNNKNTFICIYVWTFFVGPQSETVSETSVLIHLTHPSTFVGVSCVISKNILTFLFCVYACQSLLSI